MRSLVLVLLVQLVLVELAIVESPRDLASSGWLSDRSLLGRPRMRTVLAGLLGEILALVSALFGRPSTAIANRQTRSAPIPFPDHVTHIVQIGNVLVGGDAGVGSRLTDRGELWTHHGAGERTGREGRHVANAVSFGERSKSRGRGMAQEGADSRESEQRVDLHGEQAECFVQGWERDARRDVQRAKREKPIESWSSR